MDIGIPVEVSPSECRVAMTPAAVGRYVRAGHRVYVQRGAGQEAHFSDEAYLRHGAELVYGADEVYGRAELLVKVAAPTKDEYELLREEQILVCFLNAVVTPKAGFLKLLEKRVSAVALELIENDEGRLPVLRSISELAGPLSIHVAAHLLQSSTGGRGVLLGGAPGIPPATVVILGAGVAGTSAARTALRCGAEVVVLDRNLDRLRALLERIGPQVTTMMADKHHVQRAVGFADVLIGAVHVRGGPTPHVVDEGMVRKMRRGSVILDISVDQGGCVATIRPTTLEHPTYVVDNVLHYAVPNITANIARTATYALTHASFPYLTKIAAEGLEGACRELPGLASGIVVSEGSCRARLIAERFRVDHVPWRQSNGRGDDASR